MNTQTDNRPDWHSWIDGFYFRVVSETTAEVVRFIPEWGLASDEDKDRFFVDITFDQYDSEQILACVTQRYGLAGSDHAKSFLTMMATTEMLKSVAAAIYQFVEEEAVIIAQKEALGLS